MQTVKVNKHFMKCFQCSVGEAISIAGKTQVPLHSMLEYMLEFYGGAIPAPPFVSGIVSKSHQCNSVFQSQLPMQ